MQFLILFLSKTSNISWLPLILVRRIFKNSKIFNFGELPCCWKKMLQWQSVTLTKDNVFNKKFHVKRNLWETQHFCQANVVCKKRICLKIKEKNCCRVEISCYFALQFVRIYSKTRSFGALKRKIFRLFVY